MSMIEQQNIGKMYKKRWIRGEWYDVIRDEALDMV